MRQAEKIGPHFEQGVNVLIGRAVEELLGDSVATVEQLQT